jgi:hydrophobic/amphiphilic exporter-1 (mainly G- bacteria), HAE1 family
MGAPAPGYSSAQALGAIEEVAKGMPREFGYEWSGLTLQQKKSEGEAGVIFGIAILFVFLLLAAQYESWAMPFAVSAMHAACRAGNLRRVGSGQLR